MIPWLIALLASLVMGGFWFACFVIAREQRESGDTLCIREWLIHHGALSPPYNWRVLVPWVASFFVPAVRRLPRPDLWAFSLASFPVIVATPVLITLWLGNSWAGLAMALWFIGNQHIYRYNVQHPDMLDGWAHFLVVGAFWALTVGAWPWAIVLISLSFMCRENAGCLSAVVALFVGPWWVPLSGCAAGMAGILLLARPARTNYQHVLVESTPLKTLARWVRVKGLFSIHFTNTVQPLRLMPLAMIFSWQAVPEQWRWALLSFGVVFFFALPASAHSRMIAYSWPLFVPFVAALPMPWPWVFAFVSWFWPVDMSMFDESGGLINDQQRLRKHEAIRKRILEENNAA